MIAIATDTPAATINGVSDLLGNYYYPIFPFTTFGQLTLTFFAVQSLAGQNSVTIQLAVPAGTAVVTILELQDSDLNPTIVSGSDFSQSLTLTATVSSPSILIGVIYSDGPLTVLPPQWPILSQTSNLLIVYQVVSVLVSTQFPLDVSTAGQNWIGAIAAFPALLPRVSES